jgi:hypothetical protein
MPEPTRKDNPILLELLGMRQRFLPEQDEAVVDERLVDGFLAGALPPVQAEEVSTKIQTSRSWYRAYARAVAAGLRCPKS